MQYPHLIDLEDFDPARLRRILENAQQIAQDPNPYMDRCHGKILATLFYEPSTRTQTSFQTAMLRLGGQVIGFSNPQNSSVSKGESLWDTITIMSTYADILVLRHPLEGAAMAAAQVSNCPVINAGDGGHLHPTQTLTDLTTLLCDKGRLDHLTVGLCGDLKNGRTVHSLIKALSHYPGNRFVLISTEQLQIPAYLKHYLDQHGVNYQEAESLTDAIHSLDVLYMTRIQRERFASQEEYEQQNSRYILDTEKMRLASPEMIVLHPLPRVDEITVEVDRDPRARYFAQARYGMFARMALMLDMLEQSSREPVHPEALPDKGFVCENPRCITHQERYLPHARADKNGLLCCPYCDHAVIPEH